MEYIRQFNAFGRESLGVLNPNEMSIYVRLFLKANSNGWKDEWLPITNEWLQLATGIGSNNTIIAARKSLKEKGFIDFIPGGKHQPTKYKLIPLAGGVSDFRGSRADNRAEIDADNRADMHESINRAEIDADNRADNRADMHESINRAEIDAEIRADMHDKVHEKVHTDIDVRDKTEKEKDVVVGVEVRARDVIPLSEVREKKAASAQAETARSPDFAQPQQWQAVVDTYQQMRPITNEIERDKLIDLVDDYSATWVIEAVKIAIYAGARSIRYVEGILENWKNNGFGAKPKQEGMDGSNGRAGIGRRYSGQQKFFGKTGGNSRASSGRISPDDIDWSKPENQTNGW